YYQRLRDLKEDADLTQKQVAELIGVSMNHYGKYERGETDIPLEKAIILAEYYDVSLDYLAGLTKSKTSNDEFTLLKLKKADIYHLAVYISKILKDCDLKEFRKYLKK
ncbi:MAG: helix-turn-helix domain-containing protein, partial [Oscillospiraceae bacterium]|nr:helix-turn-helix domain-containing protein [Oscillospiraceae bacterium]